MSTVYDKSWVQKFRSIIDSKDGTNSIFFIGVGNPIKGDDSVGLYIISKLRQELGARPRKSVYVGPPSSAENIFSKLAKRSSKGIGSIVIFDSIEANSVPGTIVLANLRETKYGFFATHNVPLSLIPTINSNTPNIFVLGTQPADTRIGKNLSSIVSASANRIVCIVSECVRGLKG